MIQEPYRINKQLRMIQNRFRELRDRNLQTYHLTSAQMDVLIYLKCNEDQEIHQREIENWFHLKNPTVTGLLNRLEEKGFLTRRKHSSDRRYRVIELTEKGNQVLGELWEKAVEMDERVYGCISEDEREQLSKLLDRILTAMSEL